MGSRQEVSLIGSGGIIAAEHIPKGILCGLDAVALDTPIMVALQAHLLVTVQRDLSRFCCLAILTVEMGSSATASRPHRMPLGMCSAAMIPPLPIKLTS